MIAHRTSFHSMANLMSKPMTHLMIHPIARGFLGACLGACLGVWLLAGCEKDDRYASRPTADRPADPLAPTGLSPGGADPGIIPSAADLSITVTDGVTTAAPGGSITYTIAALNAAGDDVIGATVADTFPAALTCTWTCVGATGGACTAAGSGNISDVVTLPVGGSATYTASCSINPLASGTLSNTATVTPPGPVVDPVPGNNAATDSDTLTIPGSVVSGGKTVDGNFTEGGTVTYTIVLHNSAGAQADNPGNELTDILPSDLTLVSASASSGTAVATLGTNTVTWNGSIAGGASVTIAITATINAVQGTRIANQATINYDGDGNGTNETSVVTDAIVCSEP
jgi:uncharacterized repeat protein (TIGR01451 family)